jgi:hypothetical protein
MSGHTRHTDAGHADAHQSNSADPVNYGKVIGVGVGSLAIFALSIWWAVMIWHGAMNDAQARAGRAKAFDVTRTEIGIVDQVPFSSDKRLPKWRQGRKMQLEHYGWVDKTKGIVRIPIQAAMDKVAGGAMPTGAPQ